MNALNNIESQIQELTKLLSDVHLCGTNYRMIIHRDYYKGATSTNLEPQLEVYWVDPPMKAAYDQGIELLSDLRRQKKEYLEQCRIFELMYAQAKE